MKLLLKIILKKSVKNTFFKPNIYIKEIKK